jgi:hypothetical protein
LSNIIFDTRLTIAIYRVPFLRILAFFGTCLFNYKECLNRRRTDIKAYTYHNPLSSVVFTV